MNLIVSVKLEFKILKRNSKRPKLPNHSKSPSTFPDHSKNIERKTREAQAKVKKKRKKIHLAKEEFEKKKKINIPKRGLVKNPIISSVSESLFLSHSLIFFFSQIQTIFTELWVKMITILYLTKLTTYFNYGLLFSFGQLHDFFRKIFDWYCTSNLQVLLFACSLNRIVYGFDWCRARKTWCFSEAKNISEKPWNC